MADDRKTLDRVLPSHDLGRHNVHVHGEQAAPLDGIDDGRNERRPIAGKYGIHGDFHDVRFL